MGSFKSAAAGLAALAAAALQPQDASAYQRPEFLSQITIDSVCNTLNGLMINFSAYSMEGIDSIRVRQYNSQNLKGLDVYQRSFVIHHPQHLSGHFFAGKADGAYYHNVFVRFGDGIRETIPLRDYSSTLRAPYLSSAIDGEHNHAFKCKKL